MSTRKKVIIDTDVDFDDYMAIVYLLQNPDIEVVAISVTGCGAVHLSKGVENVANFLTLFGEEAEKIPVLKGAKAPLLYSNVFPQSVRDGANAHYDTPFPKVNANPNIYHTQEWLKDFFDCADEPITFLAIGGGTNIGTLFQTASADLTLSENIREKLEKIVMMGGNLLPQYVYPGAGGNIIKTLGKNAYYTNEVAEWNIFIDPLGAQAMFTFGIPITLVSLNATNQVPIERAFTEALDQINTPQAEFISHVLKYPANAAGIGTFLSFWDPLAACAVAMPELVATTCFNIIVYQVLDEEADESGKLIVDDELGSPIDIALSVNKDKVYAEYLRVLRLPMGS